MEILGAHFIASFEAMNECKGNIILSHVLFGTQKYSCDIIKTINDEDRIGVTIGGSDIYIFKRQICKYKIKKHGVILSSDDMTIAINLK